MRRTELISPSGIDTGLILNSLGDGVYVTDLNRVITHWNRAAEEITGWMADEVVGKSCFDNLLKHRTKDGKEICGKDCCPLHRAMVTETRDDEPVVLLMMTKSGKRIPIQATVAPLISESGEVIGGVETFRDLTAVHRDMERARAIQQSILHFNLPRDPRVTISVHAASHDQLGGDFHRIEEIGKDRIAFMVADVMGHGVAATLYAMQLRTLWEGLRGHLSSPKDFMGLINERLAVFTQRTSHFATAVFGLLDLRRHQVTFASGGHPSPILFRNGKGIEVGEANDPPLGLFSDCSFAEVVEPLKPGDTLLLISDGAFEFECEDKLGLRACDLISIVEQVLTDKGIPLEKLEEMLLSTSNVLRLPDDVTFLQIHIN